MTSLAVDLFVALVAQIGGAMHAYLALPIVSVAVHALFALAVTVAAVKWRAARHHRSLAEEARADLVAVRNELALARVKIEAYERAASREPRFTQFEQRLEQQMVRLGIAHHPGSLAIVRDALEDLRGARGPIAGVVVAPVVAFLDGAIAKLERLLPAEPPGAGDLLEKQPSPPPEPSPPSEAAPSVPMAEEPAPSVATPPPTDEPKPAA